MLVLPVPGRPPQDHRRQFARRDHPPDRAVGAGQMLLPDDLVEALAAAAGRRAAHSARRRPAGACNVLVGEQVGHRASLIASAAKNCTSLLLTMHLRYILDTSEGEMR